jgi:acetyl/propionyl-CoA carboxylase alpha subunit
LIRRLLIANRGEIAIRIIRACRELDIESVAVYSDADRQSPYVAAADRAVHLGPAPAAQSYLSIARVVEASRASGADAVHPGYGFLSENAAFAEACDRAGLIFVGPPAAAIARMGSKIEARKVAASAGVAVVPGETPEDQTDRGLLTALDRVGLPSLVKAASGGGGKGMRRVRDRNEALAAVQAARREATSAFGDGTLYIERLLDTPHHVEVQVFADDAGSVLHLFERECSIQRRHQKVIEESPSPLLTASLRTRMTEAAVAVARAVGYRSAGTIEFLVDIAPALSGDRSFYFLEMNTRLQVEHPVTEQVTGLDLVRAQLLVAAGEPVPWTQAQVTQRGHAIEARIYAEDPTQEFLPQAGRLAVYREPQAPGIRIDSGVVEGSEVPVQYDPLIAKIIATAETRELAARRLVAALRRFTIGGVRTNVAFLARILELDEFRAGSIDTAFLDREGARLTAGLRVDSAELEPQAAIRNPQVAMRDPWDRSSEDFPLHDARARWSAKASAERPQASAERPQASAERSPTPSAGWRAVAPMPATVIKIDVKPGDAVKKGDVLVVLEAMKMELPLHAPADGTVAAVRCAAGDLVPAEAVLVELT